MSFWFWIFWVSLGLTVFTYAGYPVVLAIAERFFYRPVKKKDFTPDVSILVLAYNEEDTIKSKLENLLSLDYPREKLEIAVASDGSTDATVEIIRGFAARGVKLFTYPVRRGKPSVLNDSVPKLSGEIILLCDSRQLFEKNCVTELMKNFADNAVGGVSGELVFKKEDGKKGIGEGLDAYWRYEKYLRRTEASIHSSVGGTGAILALRKSLWTPLPPDTLLDDVVIPFGIVKRGLRFVFDNNAHIYDRPASKGENEFSRKVRTLAGNYQILFNLSAMQNPLFTKIGLMFIGHKLLRLLMPLTLLGILFSSWNLAVFKFPFGDYEQCFYSLFFIGQVLFYFAAAFGYAFEKAEIKTSVLYIPYAFVLLHLSMLFGFFQYVSGNTDVAWHKLGSTSIIKDTGPWTFWEYLIKLLSDVLLVHAGIFIAFVVYFVGFDFLNEPIDPKFAGYWNAEIPIWITVCSLVVLHLSRINERAILEIEPEFLLNVLYALAVNYAFIILLLFLRRVVSFNLPLSVIAGGFVVSAFLLCGWRLVARWIALAVTPTNLVKRVILVSKSDNIGSVFERIQNTGFPPRSIIGVISEKYNESLGAAYLGSPDNFEYILTTNYCEEVIIHSFEFSQNEMLHFISLCDKFGIEQKIIPSYYDMVSSSSRVNLVNYIPVLEIEECTLQNWQVELKRGVDILVSLVLLVLFSPFLAVYIALNAGRLQSERMLGQNEKPFSIFKMNRNKNGKENVFINFLLALPNVLIGRMSLVGHRPLSVEEVKKLDYWEKSFFQIKPGITSLYKVMKKPDKGLVNEAVINIFYLRNYNFTRDLKIITHALLGYFFASDKESR